MAWGESAWKGPRSSCWRRSGVLEAYVSTLIRLVLSAGTARLLPGEKTEVTLTVQNYSEIVDLYRVTVDGVDPSWVSLSRGELSLFPKDQDQVRLTIQLPAGTEARAGSYDLRVQVTSVENPAERTTAPFVLEVAAQTTLDVVLRPQRQSGLAEGVFSLQVTNSGNTDLTVRLSATDPEEGCSYAFNPPQTAVPAGQSRVAQLLVRPKSPPGTTAKVYSFTVTAQPGENPKLARQVSGQLEQSARKRRSIWPVLLPVLLVLIALLAVGLALLLPRLRGKVQPTPDLAATEAVQATALAQTSGVVQATANAQATANSAAATAGARFADFALAWTGTYTCSGVLRAEFAITNTGTLPFESMDIRVVKLPGGEWVSGYQTNTPFGLQSFPPSPDCLAAGQGRLDPGARAWHGIGIATLPLGSQARTYVTLCAQDNLGGECVQKTVEFFRFIIVKPLRPLYPVLPTVPIVPVKPVVPIRPIVPLPTPTP